MLPRHTLYKIGNIRLLLLHITAANLTHFVDELEELNAAVCFCPASQMPTATKIHVGGLSIQ